MTHSVPKTLMPTYARLDKHFVRGEACKLFDDAGNAYLDALSGIGVVALGHANPVIADTVARQAQTLIHSSNVYRNLEQEALANKLTAVSGMDNCFFSNSGAEANEAAIKIARLHGKQKGIEEANIIVMERAFHGRTLATLSATASRKVQAGFEPLVPGFIRVPFNDLEALEEIADKNKHVCAIFLEPVQGEGGIHIADTDYLESVAKLCDRMDWLLMLDEVQTGNGRCGSYFAFQNYGIKPDVVTTAKGLGNGLPIGACLAAGKARDLMQAGNHGSTYGGNHLVCAAALKVVETITSPGFLQSVKNKSALFSELLARLAGQYPLIRDVRVKGLMIGIELNRDCGELVQRALDKGVLINVTGGNVIRLLPPLIISEDEIRGLVSVIEALLADMETQEAQA